MTPFGRSQILDLITALDDTIDLMKETGRRMVRYGVGFTPEMQGMADCAVRAFEPQQSSVTACRFWPASTAAPTV